MRTGRLTLALAALILAMLVTTSALGAQGRAARSERSLRWAERQLAATPVPPTSAHPSGSRWRVGEAEEAFAMIIRKYGGSARAYLGLGRCQMRLGDYRLELMEAARPESFLARFLTRRGEGMHHLSIDVEDLDTALAPFERGGVAIIDRLDFAPGRRTAFLHPRSAFGVLIQFWQVPVEEWDPS